MEEIEVEKPNKIKPQSTNLFSKSSCFGCFQRFDHNHGESEGRRRSKKRLFSRWFKFATRKKKSKTMKTVPLDSLKIVERKIDCKVESKSTEVLKSDCLVKFDGKDIGFFSNSDFQLKEKHRNVQKRSIDKLDLLDCLKEDTNDNSKDNKLLIKPRSEEDANLNNMNCQQIITKRTNSSRMLSSSSSRTAHQASSRPRSRRRNSLLTGKLEPVVGLSVVLLVLVIMLLWGKVCAILCASAWFYFIPCLRRILNFSDNHQICEENLNQSSGGIDLSSNEYKKKVILEGLLQRSKRQN
ncbi:hypothetical protein Sjap_014500 [Stephania japonica]|uniref:Transmembrane protein n=1 Tax=Stephania japonica TaxID=461633 RepID=A0AAP0NQH6_9MAGN